MRGLTYDHEKVSMNIARLRKGGENLEIVIEPNAAIEYKKGNITDITEVLKAQKIWFNARKGELASEEHLKEMFNTTDPLKIAHIIITEGEVQLTSEYREKLREQKYNKIVSLIHKNAINPVTKLVHPEERIKRAMQEAKVRIDEYKSADEQVKEVVKKIQPILPIKFVTYIAEIRIPAEYAAKNYGVIEKYGTIKKEEWLSDGSLAASVEVPAGLYTDLVDELSSKTHGNVQIEKHEKR